MANGNEEGNVTNDRNEHLENELRTICLAAKRTGVAVNHIVAAKFTYNANVVQIECL
jgi:acyl CoA:acetate/3-ketoacid CoA transferase alpha subunit